MHTLGLGLGVFLLVLLLPAPLLLLSVAPSLGNPLSCGPCHHNVGVVFLLVRVSRGEMSLGVRIRAQAPVPQAQDHGGPSIMERFKRMSPPSFKGESDPLLAESWMREIKNIFWAIRCAEDDKERADVWWSSLLRTQFEDGAVEVGWDELVAFDHRTIEQALSAVCRQEGEMEQYLEEKKASQKRPVAPF
ncbi:hypothetical protein Taro_047905 [Colocasia esculenta]|uniref:Uncharacterized protein n=1 Tax=Colocasia esculenta TaxID=4460 RepID=A0A843WX60_COLES|nr:hypothetical protein [Colocasia esculenta]